MPTLHLHLTPPQTDTQNAHLAQALTDITARVLGKRPEVTAVLIHTLPQAQWFIGAVATVPNKRPPLWTPCGTRWRSTWLRAGHWHRPAMSSCGKFRPQTGGMRG